MNIKEKLKRVVERFRKEQEVNPEAVARVKRLQDAMKYAAKTLPK